MVPMEPKTPYESYSIGDAAAATGLSIKAIRHYEEIGLIPKPRRHDDNAWTGGNRLYTATDLARLRFVRQARLLDLSLEEIGGLLEISEETCPSGHPEYHRILTEHLETVTQRVAQLSDLQARLTSLLSKGRPQNAERCSIESCDCLDVGPLPPSSQIVGHPEQPAGGTDMTEPQFEEHTYTCPKCGCEFTHAAGETAVCKCPSCETDVDTERQGCTCCD